MFKLRLRRADTHFAVIDCFMPGSIMAGYIIYYDGKFYEIKHVILYGYQAIKQGEKMPVLSDKEQIERIPELIVESFPLI